MFYFIILQIDNIGLWFFENYEPSRTLFKSETIFTICHRILFLLQYPFKETPLYLIYTGKMEFFFRNIQNLHRTPNSKPSFLVSWLDFNGWFEFLPLSFLFRFAFSYISHAPKRVIAVKESATSSHLFIAIAEKVPPCPVPPWLLFWYLTISVLKNVCFEPVNRLVNQLICKLINLSRT